MTTSTKLAEEPLDVELYKDPGLIVRGPGRDCRHNSRSKCAGCLPLDPYDAEYLAAKEIKHMSFHAYVKKVNSNQQRGRTSTFSYPLEAVVCKGHLARQTYRHVDNVSFESPDLVDAFLDAWRQSSGSQRLGILIGRYERHPDVPLGIRANVVAIFEPPQKATRDSLKLEPWEGENSWLTKLEELAGSLDLKPLGWMFTDLVQVDGGKFHYSRDAHRSYLVSAQECITAATLQNRFPNPCRLCETGVFGSKFVTVVVSGDKEGGMEFRGWQMSNHAMALAAEGLIIPTAGTPDLAYVRDDRKNVPDVKYSAKDNFGNQVIRDARPFPVEYLLVDVPAGAAAGAPARTFNPLLPTRPRFPISNREGMGQPQSLAAFATHLKAFGPDEGLALLTDFHLLHFLASNEHVPLPKDSMDRLTKAIRSLNADEMKVWLAEDPNWAQLKTLAEASAAEGSMNQSTNGEASTSGGGAEWACKHCTFNNPSHLNDCSICNLPRQ